MLNARLDASGLSRSEIAERLGLTRQGLYNKLCGLNEFKSSEIRLLSEILRLTAQERDLIFFADCVDTSVHTQAKPPESPQ
jgi:transcriptional regulator with XRE-family HTH domain